MNALIPPFSKTQLAAYRTTAKAATIRKIEDTSPYVSRSVVWMAGAAAFANVADFLANTNKGVADSWEWLPLTAETWVDYRRDKGHGFGPRSTYGRLQGVLKEAGYHFSGTFVQGWRLWESWEMGNGWDRDDEFCAGFLVETAKQYVLVDFTGYVIH